MIIELSVLRHCEELRQQRRCNLLTRVRFTDCHGPDGPRNDVRIMLFLLFDILKAVTNTGSKLSQLYNDRELLIVLDVFQEKEVRRLSHVAVVESVDLVEGYVLVTVQAKHSYEVCVLLITSEKLHFSIA